VVNASADPGKAQAHASVASALAACRRG